MSTVPDTSPYTLRDLRLLALANQAALLADRLHDLVGRHGHQVPAEQWLAGIVAPVLEGSARLQALAVAYARARGLDWAEIAHATGVDPKLARDRWEEGQPPPPDDPTALVDQVEHWYIRHLWLDPSAGVADPVRRLLDAASTNGHPGCLVCRKYAGGPIPAWAGWADPPGHHLIDDELWWVGHAPTVFSPRGALLVEARRHYLDFAEMTEAEAAAYPLLLARLIPVMKQVTGAERVHVFSNMDGAPHFHAWLMPRRPQDVKGRRFMVDPGWCTEAEAAEAIEKMRALLAAG